MPDPPDLVVRNGLIVDGTGAPPRRGDLAIRAGLITAVGEAPGRGREEIDAEGCIVTPGFVDIHTHYDGQAIWSERLNPSSWHGVTTVVMGNCGIGFAPCRPHDRERLLDLMESVEDIPFPVLADGLTWEWESFDDYLNALESRRFDVDVGAQFPHSALRVFVMGERGVKREAATAADIAEMVRLTRQAVRAGALGFTTSRTLIHRTVEGQPIPTYDAGEAELTAIAAGLGLEGRGVLQVIADFTDEDPGREVDLMRRLAQASGRPLSYVLLQTPMAPNAWREVLRQTREANETGLTMKAQVCARALGVVIGLELSSNPFSSHAAYQEIAHLPFEDRVRRMGDPSFRDRLLADRADPDHPLIRVLAGWDIMFPMEPVPDYEPPPDKSIASLAAARGVSPEEAVLDHMLSDGGRGMLYCAGANYEGRDLEACHAMLSHPDTAPGLSDGGAHVAMISDGSLPTFLLTHWARDRTRGPRLALEDVVKQQCWDTAAAVGLNDRGRLLPGLRADLNIIDHARLSLCAPTVAYDLPAGGRRLVQRADGYVATIVAGEVTYREGEPTGALPGRLVRGARGWS